MNHHELPKVLSIVSVILSAVVLIGVSVSQYTECTQTEGQHDHE